MEDNFQSAYQEEEDRLNSTLTEIDSILTKLRNTPVYTGHDYTEQVLEDSRSSGAKTWPGSGLSPISGGWISRAAAMERHSPCISAKSA